MNEHHPQVWRPSGPGRLTLDAWGWVCTCGMAGSGGMTEEEADLAADAHVQDAIDRAAGNWRNGDDQ